MVEENSKEWIYIYGDSVGSYFFL